MTASTVTAPTNLADLVAPAAASLGHRRILPLPQRVQFSYNTRFVSEQVAQAPGKYHLIAGQDVRPRPGDVLIARVHEIANHKRVETETSRKARLFEGSLIALAYGHRYAADQFLAHVPATLDHCHLVAAGGIAGQVTEQHSNISGPSQIEPLGLLATDTGVVRLIDAAPHTNTPVTRAPSSRPEVIAVLGTSMNSGKSTVMAHLVNGLSNAGLSVGAGKITGTGAGNDPSHYEDAGANHAVDFTDFGYGSTFRQDFDSLRSLTVNMVDLLGRGNNVVIVEIADGIYQEETARLLADDIFQATVDQVAFAAVDALGARAGVQTLQDAGLDVAVASGVMTSSPLATAEASAVLAPLRTPVIGTFDLSDATQAKNLLVR